QREAREPVPPEEREVDGHGERAQTLIGADVGGGTLAANVLLARGEGQHVAAAAVRVDRLADQTARHAAHEALARGEEPDARAAVAHGEPEALPPGHRNVRGRAGTPRPRPGSEDGARAPASSPAGRAAGGGP